MFMQGDSVRYVGSKSSLKKAGRGEVLAPMGGEPGVYVVEFSDAAYVVADADLNKYLATPQDLEQAAKATEVVQKKRRKHSDEE